MRVLAHREMGQEMNWFAGSGKFVVARQWNKNFVTDAVHIDNRLRWQRADQSTIKKRDHGRFDLPQSAQRSQRIIRSVLCALCLLCGATIRVLAPALD